mmetsp:Transcript_47981/g.51911  ORF Transcript_47981/g.51911 Transcript_47981/m.51911 type:complete len:89 (+) Transcript_47981:779-1045(+)
MGGDDDDDGGGGSGSHKRKIQRRDSDDTIKSVHRESSPSRLEVCVGIKANAMTVALFLSLPSSSRRRREDVTEQLSGAKEGIDSWMDD